MGTTDKLNEVLDKYQPPVPLSRTKLTAELNKTNYTINRLIDRIDALEKRLNELTTMYNKHYHQHVNLKEPTKEPYKKDSRGDRYE